MPSVQLQAADRTWYNEAGKPLLDQHPGCRATQTTPRWDLLEEDPEEWLAIDVEFQTYKYKEEDPFRHRMGRVAFVNTRGQTVYDTYVRYKREEGLICRVNPRFGVTWKDLKAKNGAVPISQAEKDLYGIMKGRTIIGHGMRLDIESIDQKLWDVVEERIDTQSSYGQVNLKALVDRYLNIKFNWHDPTEDARATMLLHMRRQPYQGRSGFKEHFVFDANDYPPLGV